MHFYSSYGEKRERFRKHDIIIIRQVVRSTYLLFRRICIDFFLYPDFFESFGMINYDNSRCFIRWTNHLASLLGSYPQSPFLVTDICYRDMIPSNKGLCRLVFVMCGNGILLICWCLGDLCECCVLRWNEAR